MKLSERQEKLLEFVKMAHGDQVRKYTGEPYWHHLINVAEILFNQNPSHISYDGLLTIEIALCHDILEDTKINEKELHHNIFKCGYSSTETHIIVCSVIDLTDHYTKEKYPNLNRKERKILECNRMSNISELSMFVKYADIIDNCKSIVEHDKQFAKVFLSEKKDLLNVMYITLGSYYKLYCEAKELVRNSELSLF